MISLVPFALYSQNTLTLIIASVYGVGGSLQVEHTGILY